MGNTFYLFNVETDEYLSRYHVDEDGEIDFETRPSFLGSEIFFTEEKANEAARELGDGWIVGERTGR